MTAMEIAREITRAHFNHEDLQLLNDALRANFRRNRTERLEAAQSALNGGETVRLSGIRPRCLNGMEGTVGRFNGGMTRADVTITKSGWGRGSWKYPVGHLLRGVPLVCMTKVETEPEAKPRRRRSRNGA